MASSPPVSPAACAVAGMPWCEACSTTLAPPSTASTLLEQWRPAALRSLLFLQNASEAELRQLAGRVVDVLHERGLLCSGAGGARRPCRAFIQRPPRGGPPVLHVCPPRERRIFCAPYATDRTTSARVRKFAAGCVVPELPCKRFDLAMISYDVHRLRTTKFHHHGAFFGPDDVDEVYRRIQRRDRSLSHLTAMLQPMRPPSPLIHRRCALVGANHVVRCRSWGARIDGAAYDAIFRVNGFQLDAKRVHNQWLDPRHAGTRTTYRQSCLTSGRRLASSRSEVCLLTPDFLSRQRDHTDHTQVCGGARLRSEYTERSVAAATAQGFRFLLFGRDAPYRSLQGEGSGDAAFLTALALCEDVHVYAVGLHGQLREDGSMEFVYQHGYDALLGRCQPHTNTTCVDEKYATSQMLREVQWAVWHALGLAQWVYT